MERLLGAEHKSLTVVFVADFQDEFALEYEDRFVLYLVILKTECMTGVDVEEFSDVAVCVRPNDLVSPGFFYAFHRLRYRGVTMVLNPSRFSNSD